ncbi:PadR family transcriptional regulator [Arthrobacter halodurans]|uniref:Helix-turn-helix transcriptional regulator n=1 Tax=Arthrobacter halodurans TaxID=516699 RepID=A0ABV4UMV5_9MICC
MDSIGRVTPATARVLEVLLDAKAPIWGLLVVKGTGKKAGTVYPILDKLESAGWVTSQWEESTERKGPRRRYYRIEPSAHAVALDYVRTQQRREATAHSASPSAANWRSA